MGKCRNTNWAWKADITKAPEKLGMTFRPLADTMQEHFQQLIDEGVFAKDAKKAA